MNFNHRVPFLERKKKEKGKMTQSSSGFFVKEDVEFLKTLYYRFESLYYFNDIFVNTQIEK